MARRFAGLLLVWPLLIGNATAQTVGSLEYVRREEMIPMRDGVKLFTIILAPKSSLSPMPFMYLRTPYSAVEYPPPFPAHHLSYLTHIPYIFASQSITAPSNSQ